MKTLFLYQKSILYFLISIFFIFQFYITFNLEIYPETHTVLKWYQSDLGIFENLGMRILDDGTFKATYSFIYLLPVYFLFIIFKFFSLPDTISLGLSNFITINSQLILLFYVSKKFIQNFHQTFILYFIFFVGTFMWTGLQRVFPHDIIILLALFQIVFPKLKFFFMALMVYIDPVIGSLFVILFNFFLELSEEKNYINSLFISIKNSFLPIVFGFLLWQIPILYLENISQKIGDSSSIYNRIFGFNDPYFYTRLQIFTPFHYYLPLYIQSSFSSFKFGALIFAASNIITPISLYLIYKYKSDIIQLYNQKNVLLISGLSLMIAYLLFALVFGQAAASHRFDYDQYFQAGLLFVLISLSSIKDILKDKLIILSIFYHFLFILPYLLIHFIILRL